MPLVPPPELQHVTRSKSAVIEHLRESAPDKIDVLLHVNAQNLNSVVAHIRKQAADGNSQITLILAQIPHEPTR